MFNQVKKSKKEKCIICGSVRHRSQLVRTPAGLVHLYHKGVSEEVSHSFHSFENAKLCKFWNDTLSPALPSNKMVNTIDNK